MVGPNGTGKSTLLKLCAKEMKPVKGYVWHHAALRIGVYSQHAVDQLDLSKSAVQYLMDKFPIKYEEARKLLGTIGLPGANHEQRMATLSGGQKSRVVLVELQLTKAHILLLDEPTNHLDLETVDGLIRALQAFQGGLMIVTHNISLIEAVCNEIWVCGTDKTVTVIYLAKCLSFWLTLFRSNRNSTATLRTMSTNSSRSSRTPKPSRLESGFDLLCFSQPKKNN